jgi:hypothetical protein
MDRKYIWYTYGYWFYGEPGNGCPRRGITGIIDGYLPVVYRIKQKNKMCCNLNKKEPRLKPLSHLYLSSMLILFILQISNPHKVYSQEIGDNSTGSGWGGYPVLFYTSRTGVALGAYGTHYFKNEGTPHKSTISLALVYTLRSQINYPEYDFPIFTDKNYEKYLAR